jgi:hypothetical protein
MTSPFHALRTAFRIAHARPRDIFPVHRECVVQIAINKNKKSGFSLDRRGSRVQRMWVGAEVQIRLPGPPMHLSEVRTHPPGRVGTCIFHDPLPPEVVILFMDIVFSN